MKIRHLLAVAAASAAVASASAFEWTPSIQPNPESDITANWQLETLTISADANLEQTDVMPIWIDENENQIIGTVSEFSDPSWQQYVYNFNISDFKGNGEYVLLLPEGLLKNAAGELSDKKEFYYTVDVPELAGPMFEDFKVLSVEPDLSSPQGIWSDQVIKINTNHNEAIGLTTLKITDLTDDSEYATNLLSMNFTTERGTGESSSITWEVVGTYKFYEEHEYKAELVFYNGPDEIDSDGNPTPVVAKETYTFTGKVEGFKYSEITLQSISPAPYTLTITEPSQAVFTYTFSGPVNVYKAASPQALFGVTTFPESCLSSNEEKTVWTLDLSNDTYVQSIDAELVIYLYVRDLDGSQLKGNDGEGDNSYYTAAWQCDLGAKEIVVVTPERGATLDSLTEVVVKSVSGEEMSYNWGSIAIENLLGQTLGTLLYEQPEGEDGGAATEFHFTRWIPEGEWSAEPLNIVAEGSYKIFIPTGAFVFGEQYESVNSRSLYSGFQITGNLDDTPDDPGVDPAEQETLEYTAVDPENGSTVEKIDVIKISFAEDIMLNGCDVVVYSADQKVVGTGAGDLDFENFVFDYVLVKLKEPITEPGRYMVSIPARSIATDGYEEGKVGTCIPEIRLTYTVGTELGVDSISDASLSNVYDMQGRIVLRDASAEAIKSLEKGIYIVGGKKVVVK